MFASLRIMLKKMTPFFLEKNQLNYLGRWNSVIKPIPVEKNRYIDWGNMDHCCCSFIDKKVRK